ncbi:gliding motility-associated C-terminal domain-containing protein, partial [Mucilaginibacter polytrichastri]
VPVTPITPVLTWSDPATITYGTLLSATQLNAQAMTSAGVSIAGTFEYQLDPSGTVIDIGTLLAAGSHPAKAIFHPTDVTTYADNVGQTATIVVNPALPTITWTIPISKPYGTTLGDLPVAGSNVAGTFTYEYDSNQINAAYVLPAGTLSLLAKFTPTDAVNYSFNSKAATITISKSSQTIALTGTITTKTYGDAAFDISAIPVIATASSELPVTATIKSGSATISGTVITITGSGIVTVAFNQAGNDRYNAATERTLTFFVNTVQPVITWVNPTNIIYGTALSDAQLYASTTIPGTFSYSPAPGTVLHAGNVQQLTATFTPTDAVNYNTATQKVFINVIKAPLTVSVDNVSRPYNQPNPDFQINYLGFVNGDTKDALTNQASASTTANTASLVGTYPIILSAGASNDYTFKYINATLAITSISRDVTFDKLPVKTYGDADFNAGAVSTSGEPIIYTSSNSAVATVINGLVHIVGAGYVTITASLPVNPGYNINPSISQFMIVNKASQVIDFANIPVQMRGSTYSLSAVKSSAGLPVTFTTNDPMIASISGQTIKALRIGITGIVANQAGDANYYAANTVVRPIDVQDPNREVIVHPALSPNGDGINDVLYIEGINEHPDNRVTLINRNGVRVYEISGYDNTTKAFNGSSNFTGARQQAGTYFYLVEYVVNGVGRHLTGYFVLKYE